MRKLFLATAVALSASGLLARPAPAAPIDDAKAALAQKQYDKVDALLAADLAARAPSPAALRVSLDAAVASGRVVTAAARATALLKAAGEKDPDLLLLGRASPTWPATATPPCSATWLTPARPPPAVIRPRRRSATSCATKRTPRSTRNTSRSSAPTPAPGQWAAPS